MIPEEENPEKNSNGSAPERLRLKAVLELAKAGIFSTKSSGITAVEPFTNVQSKLLSPAFGKPLLPAGFS